MKYTSIAGYKISNMSLGTVQLGMNYGIANESGKPDRKQSYSMLAEALDNGITSLDTARGYGESEEVLGSFFKENRHSLPFITTKFMTTLPAGSSAEMVEKEIVESVESSLSRLGVKKVNCILMHRPEDMTKHGNIVPNTLKKLINMGYTDIVGVSVYFPDEVDTMLKNDLYQAIQIPMNLFDQKLIHSGHLERLRQKNICTFVRSVFLQGLFFLDPYNMKDPDLNLYAAPHLKKLHLLAERSSMSVAQFAISFIRDLPGVTSLVLGADTPKQVRENISLLDGPMIGNTERQEALEAFADVDLEAIMNVLRRPKG